MFCVHARHTSSRSVQGRAGGADNSRFLGIGERACSIGTRRCAELLDILRVCIVRDLSAQYLPRMQQQRYVPDGDQRKSPEIATGRSTSPSADACPTQHCGKTQSRPARHVPASVTSTRVRVAGREPAQRSRPPAVPGTASPHACRYLDSRRASTPHLRTPHASTTRTHSHPACTQKVPGNKVFRIWQVGARDSGNKIAASAHGMGSGGSAVEAMAIGCLGVDRRVELFFPYLAILSPGLGVYK
jgi:hypothetical protein